jgi:hypothetical protein
MNPKDPTDIDGLEVRIGRDNPQPHLPDLEYADAAGWCNTGGIFWRSRGRTVNASHAGHSAHLRVQESTGGFVFSNFCAAAPAGSWIAAGAGACTFSLVNDNHKRLHAALAGGSIEGAAQRFGRQACFTDAGTRQLLLGGDSPRTEDTPVEDLILREVPGQAGMAKALFAFVSASYASRRR